MTENKWIAKSVTALGAAIAALPAFFNLIGVEFTAAEAADATKQVEILIEAAVTLFGSITAVVGRVRASTKATLFPNA